VAVAWMFDFKENLDPSKYTYQNLCSDWRERQRDRAQPWVLLRYDVGKGVSARVLDLWVLEGLCDVGLVVELGLGLGLGNRRGGERENQMEERVCGGDHTKERWRTEERESL
jgi:hypothetical protein